MTKKRILWILAGCLLLGGCGISEPAAKNVGLCVRQGSEFYRALRTRLEELGYAVTLCDSVGDQSRQNEQVARCIEEGCDLLLVEPVLTCAPEQVLDRARQENIPVVFLEHMPDPAALDSWSKAYFVGHDPREPGLLQGQLVSTLSGGCAVLCGPEEHLDAQLHREGLGACMPQTQCLEVCCTDWTQASARGSCARLLAKYGSSLTMLLCGSPDLALGALDAAQAAGRTPGEDLFIFALGQDAALLEQIQAGAIRGTVCRNEALLTETLLGTARSLLDGGSPEKRQYISWQILDHKE